MTLFNVTFTDAATERTVTVDVDSEEEALTVVAASYARAGYAFDGKVEIAPESPPPTESAAEPAAEPVAEPVEQTE